MFSFSALWFQRAMKSRQRNRRPWLARRPRWKLWVEVLEDRTVLSSWSTVAPMPTSRFGLAAATASDGRIYAIGGFDGINIYSTVEAYTPSTNTWTTVTQMNTARYELAAAVGSDGQIYAIGGFTGAAAL